MKDCICAGETPAIKRGDECAIQVRLFFNGAEIGAPLVPMLEELEFAFEGQTPVRIAADEAWSDALDCFLLPVTQEQTFALDRGYTTLDLRVRFHGGNVLGARQKARVKIADANSWEVIS